MNTRPFFSCCRFLSFGSLLLAIGSTLNPPTVSATTYSWSGAGANGNWTNAANWSGNVGPVNDGTADIVYPKASNTAATLDTGYSIDSLSFPAAAAAYTLGAANGAQLTLGSGGLNQGSTLLQTINAPVVLGVVTQSWAVGSGGLTLTGGVTGNAQYLTLVKTGSGTLTLTGTPSNLAGFNGELDVDGGKVTLASDLALTLFDLGNHAGPGTVEQTGGTASMESLALGAGAGQSGSYTLSGGTLVTSQTVFGYQGQGTFKQTGGTHTPSTLSIGFSDGSGGTYTLSGGTLSSNSESVGGTAGAFVQDGAASVNNTSSLAVGSSPATTCTYTLSAGSLTVSNLEFIGNTGGALFEQNGGNHTVSELYMGFGGGGYPPSSPYTSVYQLNGGTFTVQEQEIIGNYSQGTFTQTGGTHQVGLNLSLSSMTGFAPSSLSVSGGTLSVGGSLGVGSGPATMSVTGTGAVAIKGALTLGGSPATTHVTITGGGTVQAGDLGYGSSYMQVGGISLSDPAKGGLALIVGSDNTDSMFYGSITDAADGPGSLEKVGTGTLYLNGASTYTGDTLVNAGTLQVGGTFKGSRTLQVASGASLEVASGASVNVGQVVNAGRLRLVGSAAISASGELVNSGTLDLISWQGTLPANFVNEAGGSVLTTSSVRITGVKYSGGTTVVTFQAYAGHNYVLQNSPTLNPATWSTGSANPVISPKTDGVVTLTDYPPTKTTVRFYRIAIDP